MHCVSLQVISVTLYVVLLRVRLCARVQAGLKSTHQEGLQTLSPAEVVVSACQQDASRWLDLLAYCVDHGPVCQEHRQTCRLLNRVVLRVLFPEHSSQLLFVLHQQAGMVVELLEQMGFRAKLVVHLELLSGQLQPSHRRLSWIVKLLESCVFEDVSQNLAFFVCREFDPLGGELLGFFGCRHV